MNRRRYDDKKKCLEHTEENNKFRMELGLGSLHLQNHFLEKVKMTSHTVSYLKLPKVCGIVWLGGIQR